MVRLDIRDEVPGIERERERYREESQKRESERGCSEQSRYFKAGTSFTGFISTKVQILTQKPERPSVHISSSRGLVSALRFRGLVSASRFK